MPNLLEKRLSFKPFEYPDLTQYVDGINNTYWLVSEVDFTADIQHFKVELTEVERYIIGTILKTFAQTEVFVSDEFWSKIGEYLPKPEISLLAATFSENEYRHAVAYVKLNEVLGLTDFEAFMTDEVAKDRFENLLKIRRDHEGKPSIKDIARTLAVFSAFTENVNLFSQFAILRSFSANGRNLLPNIGNIIDWSQLDEQIHAQCGMFLFNKLIEENPEVFTNEFKSEIYTAARITYDIETKLIDQIFARGELPNLTKEQLLNFMKDRINKSLKAIKLKPIFDIDKDLLKEMQWFYDSVDAKQHADFFARRPVEYTKNMVKFNKDTVRVAREEIKKLINKD